MKYTDFILILLLIILIGVICYAIYFIKTDGFKCLSSPLTYGAEKMENKYGEMFCTCSNGINFNKTSAYLVKNSYWG